MLSTAITFSESFNMFKMHLRGVGAINVGCEDRTVVRFLPRQLTALAVELIKANPMHVDGG